MNDSRIPLPITIPYVEDDTQEHQAPYYFCSKPDCPCHDDPELTAELQRHVTAGEITASSALEFYWNIRS